MKNFIRSLFLVAFLPNLLFAQSEQIVSSLDGFAEASWGMTFESIREKFISMATNPESKEQIEIINEKKDEKLLIKRNGIFYLYRFYKTPDIVRELRPREDKRETDPSIVGQTEYRESGILFSVGVTFNLVPSEKIREKLEGKYGKPRKESIGDDKVSGAAIWELVDRRDNPPRGGFAVQWREGYKKAPYTRRIDYFSANIRDMIAKDYKDFFSVQETKTLRDLIP
ncbi:hypothetical protein [Leptospira idonii]|uniref:TNF family profile domain-containing protein n=1 Tax=Leptospira idonii TaxID=1193500 RepID=A0A4V3JXS7_9LEPT|nr:hypothetical protein [Leptospira idonii]TGN17976.1 hypothetical protein EHS15_15690 [Leptospira idonii]